ncbi:MAG: T9SS type A sorting domain-containing protein, partial [Bacteroidota bacterium]
MPEDMSSNVTCYEDAVVPTPPEVYDNCGQMLMSEPGQTGGTYDGCEGTIIYPFIYTDCAGNSHVWNYTYYLNDDVAPVWNQEMPESITVECNDIPLPATVSATDNCEGILTLTYNETVTEGSCLDEYVISRTWLAEDACENSITHTQIINVIDNTAPVIDCPEDIITGVCCDAIIEIPEATDNCDDDVSVSWIRDDGAQDLNAPFEIGTTSITFTATDNCGNTDECTMTVTIVDDPDLTMSWAYGEDFDNLICGQHEINTLDVIVDGGDGVNACNYEFIFSNPSWYVVEGNTGSIDNGYHTFRINAEGDDECMVILILSDIYGCAVADTLWFDNCIAENYCSYTQGFYGNTGGLGCGPDGYGATAYDIMSNVMMPYDTVPVLFGLPGNGWELYYHDITQYNIFNMLPGGGTSAPFDPSDVTGGIGTYDNEYSWGMVPLKTNPVQAQGKIQNNLFAQTLTFFFNMMSNVGFDDLEITAEYLVTADAIDCGTQLASEYATLYTEIPSSVVDYLNDPANGYDPTAQGLFLLANDLLGGASALQTGNSNNPDWIISHADVCDALDAFNNGFDECRIFVGFMETPPAYAEDASSYDPENGEEMDDEENQEDEENEGQDIVEELEVTAHPNPFKKKINFKFSSSVDTHVKFEIITLGGSMVSILFDENVLEGTNYHVTFSGSQAAPGIYFYRITTDYGTYNGKIIKQ